jgi:cellulose synthase operon protein YhjQ
MSQLTPRCIAFVSPVGGTGQTTVVANLASLWCAAGLACLAVDLCPQNSLGLHLGLRQAPVAGWASSMQADQWWADAALENSSQVPFLPFGCPPLQADAPPLQHLHQRLAQDPQWLRQQLQAVDLPDHTLVLLDAPSAAQALTTQALRCADLMVVCLDASPRSPLQQAQVQALVAQARLGTRVALLVTRFNPRRASQCLAMAQLQQQWPGQLAPYVLHDDENVAAALAAAHCVTAYAPQSQSAHDLHGIARWLLAQCPPDEPAAGDLDP